MCVMWGVKCECVYMYVCMHTHSPRLMYARKIWAHLLSKKVLVAYNSLAIMNIVAIDMDVQISLYYADFNLFSF